MTTQPAQAVLTAPYQSERLRQLHAEYSAAKAASDAASERLKALTDALKVEMQTVAVGAEKILLPASEGAPALRLARTETWRLDSTRLKREHLELWVQYAKKSETWVLRAAAGGDTDE